MRITVAVAAYGRPDDLGRCLAALAGQQRAPHEVIVVDQAASEEASAAVAGSGLEGARYVPQPPAGLSASRNAALREATGDVLAVTDDDCMPAPGWIAAVAAALARPPAVDAVTGAVRPPDGPRPAGAVAVSSRGGEAAVDFTARVAPWRVGTGGNFAARVGALRAVGGWDERLGAGSAGRAGEDIDLLYRLLASGTVVRYDPAAVVHHAWQAPGRRRATRSSYAFGVGAMCGLHLGRRDRYAARVLAAYARMQLRGLRRRTLGRDLTSAGEHVQALAALGPGVAYGLRHARGGGRR